VAGCRAPVTVRPDDGPEVGSSSDDAALELAALALRETAPDAEPLVVLERVLQALRADLAARADLLGLARGPALLREEGLRVRLGAERALLPPHERVVDRLAEERQHRCHALHLSFSVGGESPSRPV